MNRGFNSTDGVCIVGVGAATPIGMTAPASAAAARAGIANFVDHSTMVDAIGEPFVIARAPYVDGELASEDRFVNLARRAACEALEPLSKKSEAPIRVSLIVGLPEFRPGLPENLATTLAAKLGETAIQGCRIAQPTTLSKGHSAGLMAIGLACEMVRSGHAEFCLAGGVDSYLDDDSLTWIEDGDQLHSPENAWGFVPGEAAGFCLIATETTAAHYGLSVLGRLLGVAVAHEENRIKTETVCIGKGLTAAVQGALALLGPSGTRIDHMICDLNGEAYRADEFGFMLARTSERFINPSDFTAPADCWGDVGAASGPLFMLLACAAAAKGYAPGPVTLMSTSSEGGERAAALFLATAETS